MPAITIDQLLVVNVAEIDAQHRGIVEMINRLHEALLHADPARVESERRSIWESLVSTFREHFATEQNVMAEVGYPLLAEHTGKHRRFLDQIEGLRDDAEGGFIPLNSELMKTLSGWFVTHETEEDRGLAEFLRRRG